MLHIVINQSFRVFHAFLKPVKVNFLFFFIRKVPTDIRAAHFFRKMGENDGSGIGYVEAFGEAVHGNQHISVCVFYSLIGKTSNVGGKMKVTGTTYWMSPNTGATNSSGFSARGGGYRPNGYGFDDIRKSAVFWTTSTYNSDFTYDFMMSYDAGELYRYGSSSYDYSISKKSGLSVRCVKNNSKDTYEDSNIPATPAKSREARH